MAKFQLLQGKATKLILDKANILLQQRQLVNLIG